MTVPYGSPMRPLSSQVAALIVLVLLFAVLVTGHRIPSGAPSTGSAALASVPAPPRDGVMAALDLQASRTADAAPGRVAFALALPDGRVIGDQPHATFASASLAKSLLAVTLLRSRRWSRDRGALADGARMILWSDNDAATRTLARLGSPEVRTTAGVAGLRDFSIGSSWSEARVSARDFARLMLIAPHLVPPHERARLRTWFAGVVPAQSWGIPQVLRPMGAQVLFKGAWRDGLAHQAARVELDGRTYGLAVLTDRQTRGLRSAVPTIEHITRTLLGPRSPLLRARP